MALAEYFERNALAAAHAIAGFDPAHFRETLESARVGIVYGREAAASAEGRALLDLATRLLARLYPRLAIVTNVSDSSGAELADLARAINPRIELAESGVDHALVVGGDAPTPEGKAFFLGCDHWTCVISTRGPVTIGTSPNPVGAGAAACLGAGNLFRAIFLSGDHADHDLRFSVAELISGRSVAPTLTDLTDDGRSALAGLGAIGNAVVWTLARTPMHARLHLVDDQTIDLSNLSATC